MPISLTEGQYFGQSIRSAADDFFNCSITTYESNAFIQKHYHENNYLSILLKGHYSEKNSLGDSMVEGGNIIFRPALYDHINNFQQIGGTCFNLEFKQNWKDQLDIKLNLPENLTIYKPGVFPSLYKFFYYFCQKGQENLQHEFILDWLFEVNQQIRIKSSLPWIEKVIKIIEDEVDVHHTIHSISERVFVHPIYLAGAFKKKTGYTIGEYQLKTKLEKAIQLLLNSRLSINEIAFSTGFFDAAHFIKSFKLSYQTSPNKFRGLKKVNLIQF